MAKKLTIEEVRQFVQENSDCELLSTEYVNADVKLKFRCGCGEEFEAAFTKFKHRNKRQCSRCGRKAIGDYNRHSIDYVISFIRSKSECEFVAGEYVNNMSKLKLKCSCGKEFSTDFANFRVGKQQCNSCGRDIMIFKQRKTPEKFKREVEKISGNEYVFLDDYVNSKTHLKVKHRVCGNTYNTLPNNFLKGHRCPFCSKNGYSKGEREIINILEILDIFWGYQIKLPGCKNEDLLPFDFAVFSSESHEKPEFLIEYDGIQHFEPVDFFGGQERFEKQQLHDRIKDDYCKQNGIELIRIPYWEQDNIEEILSEKLSRLLTEDTERLELAVL